MPVCLSEASIHRTLPDAIMLPFRKSLPCENPSSHWRLSNVFKFCKINIPCPSIAPDMVSSQSVPYPHPTSIMRCYSMLFTGVFLVPDAILPQMWLGHTEPGNQPSVAPDVYENLLCVLPNSFMHMQVNMHMVSPHPIFWTIVSCSTYSSALDFSFWLSNIFWESLPISSQRTSSSF